MSAAERRCDPTILSPSPEVTAALHCFLKSPLSVIVSPQMRLFVSSFIIFVYRLFKTCTNGILLWGGSIIYKCLYNLKKPFRHHKGTHRKPLPCVLVFPPAGRRHPDSPGLEGCVVQVSLAQGQVWSPGPLPCFLSDIVLTPSGTCCSSHFGDTPHRLDFHLPRLVLPEVVEPEPLPHHSVDLCSGLRQHAPPPPPAGGPALP